MWTVTYLEKEAGVSKHSWKKIMQLLWADVTYLLINVKHRINMTLIVLIDIRHPSKLQQIWRIPCNLSRWWICNISFCMNFLYGSKFLTSLDCSRIPSSGKNWNKLRHWLFWKHLSSFSRWLVNLLLSLPQKI